MAQAVSELIDIIGVEDIQAWHVDGDFYVKNNMSVFIRRCLNKGVDVRDLEPKYNFYYSLEQEDVGGSLKIESMADGVAVGKVYTGVRLMGRSDGSNWDDAVVVAEGVSIAGLKISVEVESNGKLNKLKKLKRLPVHKAFTAN